MNYRISTGAPFITKTAEAVDDEHVFGSLQTAKLVSIAGREQLMLEFKNELRVIRGLKEKDLPTFEPEQQAQRDEIPAVKHSPGPIAGNAKTEPWYGGGGGPAATIKGEGEVA